MDADLTRLRISCEGWSRRVEWLRAGPESGSWRAKVGLRAGASLLVEWSKDLSRGVELSLWAGEPEESPGAALIREGDMLKEIARVPVCTCGEQGCANASWQFSVRAPDHYLPRVVDSLQSLPVSRTITDYASVWRDECWCFPRDE